MSVCLQAVTACLQAVTVCLSTSSNCLSVCLQAVTVCLQAVTVCLQAVTACLQTVTRLPLEGYSSNWYLSISLKSVDTIQISSKYDKNNRYCIRRRRKLYGIIWLGSSYHDKYFRQILYRKSKQILCSKTTFINRAVYVIVWNNSLQPDRLQIAM